MTQVIPFEHPSDRAFREFLAARDVALASGDRADANHAARLFGAFLESCLPKERQWPRDNDTLRPLMPHELPRRGA